MKCFKKINVLIALTMALVLSMSFSSWTNVHAEEPLEEVFTEEVFSEEETTEEDPSEGTLTKEDPVEGDLTQETAPQEQTAENMAEESLEDGAVSIGIELSADSARVLYSGERLVLYPNIKNERKMEQNSINLQAAVDLVSESGGGTIKIPTGEFYFKPVQRNFDTPGSVLTRQDINAIEYHVIKCKDNVTITGTLNADGSLGTTLLPVGETLIPIDMFFFADLFEKGDVANPNYLVNNHFRDFIIDGSNTHNPGYYNAKGKGFYFCLFKDCSWDNVTVMNTDGTGFGMDCPINSSITNCTAIGCGKQADRRMVGASGFGIGFGYSEEESMTIENCTAVGNRKFGIFFEHQGRFGGEFQAKKSKGFQVNNCKSRGNLYDFGGEMCRNLTYTDCLSEALYDTDMNPLNSVNERPYYFGTYSTDYHIFENGKEIKIWTANKRCYKDVYGWFVEEGWFDKVLDLGLMYGYADANGELTYVFGQDDSITRAQIAVMLFRYTHPDSVWNDKAKNQTPFHDCLSGQYYTEAMNWAYKERIFTGDRKPDGSMTGFVRPDDSISRQELALVLYRFAKENGADVTNFDRTLYLQVSGADQVGDWAAEAMAWCYANRILTGGTAAGTGLMPMNSTTRGHAGKMIPQTLVTFP